MANLYRGGTVAERRLIRLDPNDTARALAKVPLFAGCSDADLRDIAGLAHMLIFDDGATIVPEGEEGLGFYLILSGEAAVVQAGNEINRIGSGQFFGEIALLEGTPRTASVVALSRTVCLGILRSDFRPLLVRQPRIALRILEEEGRRIDPDAAKSHATMARVHPPE
ncbi:MAG TPA: cyclic nucleotide-binding domain-containing protein [Actinomycetota bacterium]|nr:cyclic nucleotide-binding domain-containing protein [Actinomycetota bacterium]